MNYRKLRIAWSVLCGLAAVLLCVLWARDYLDTRLLASLPYACPTLLLLAFAAAPWTSGRSQFSLRTLLLALTLVAVVLGVIVWL
jgi:hypothetical protein